MPSAQKRIHIPMDPFFFDFRGESAMACLQNLDEIEHIHNSKHRTILLAQKGLRRVRQRPPTHQLLTQKGWLPTRSCSLHAFCVLLFHTGKRTQKSPQGEGESQSDPRCSKHRYDMLGGMMLCLEEHFHAVFLDMHATGFIEGNGTRITGPNL